MAKKAAKKAVTSRKSAASPSKSAKKIDLFESVQTIKNLVSTVDAELTDFDQKGVKAAARRARKALQELRRLCGNTRKDIMETMKRA